MACFFLLFSFMSVSLLVIGAGQVFGWKSTDIAELEVVVDAVVVVDTAVFTVTVVWVEVGMM